MCEHAEGHVAHSHQVRGHQVVLDIGGNLGALVIYTAAGRAGDEIEVFPAVEAGEPTHSQVHPRIVGETTVFAAVYPGLVAGAYVFSRESTDCGDGFTIAGGEVTQLDWR